MDMTRYVVAYVDEIGTTDDTVTVGTYLGAR
jgi:hypothetical protein